MSILSEFIINDKLSSAIEYVNGLISSNKKQAIIYSSTGNIPIDSVLNYKLNDLNDKDIVVQMEINVPTELPIEIMDITTILTNLLDNAIYALQKSINEKNLSISVKYSKGMLIIRISISYDGIVLYENGEIITTKTNGDEHGKGMINVRKVAEKYNGLLKLSHNDQFFTSEVLLYLH